ncbi:hypothetical protein, partial [Salmonella sp. s51228]|uniref:hypothetical protein n=1 Tax=Salmonella sp. s51228 TaxID=3159652 RepID=UPI003980755F
KNSYSSRNRHSCNFGSTPAESSIPQDNVTPNNLRNANRAAKSKTVYERPTNDIGPEAITIQPLSKSQLQFCLAAYVNKELKPSKRIEPIGESLYLVCANPKILCLLLNVSRPGTVDMRALTEIRDNASDAEIKEAIEDNMTLAIQS